MDDCSVCHIWEKVVEYGGALRGGFGGMPPHLLLYIFQLILLSKTLIIKIYYNNNGKYKHPPYTS